MLVTMADLVGGVALGIVVSALSTGVIILAKNALGGAKKILRK